jgi:hypothetical protein
MEIFMSEQTIPGANPNDATNKAEPGSVELNEGELTDVSGGAGPTGSVSFSIGESSSKTGFSRTATIEPL